jgi:hypothetical protein
VFDRAQRSTRDPTFSRLETIFVNEPRDRLWSAIEAAPDDPGRYGVLGDLLSSEGDPRGELITLQLSPRLTPAQRAREATLLRTKGLRIPRATRAQWRWGFVHTLAFELTRADGWEAWRVPDGERTWGTELLAGDLEHPSCRFLRELFVEGDPGEVALRALSARPPGVLRSLQVVCNEVDLSALGPGLARLERLVLSAQLMTPARLPLPALTDLQLPLDALTPTGTALVLTSVARTLTSLTITSLEPVDGDLLTPVGDLPALTSLTIRADTMSRSAVDALTEGPLCERLEVLDLSRSGLTAEAAQRLLKRTNRFARLSSLVLGESIE